MCLLAGCGRGTEEPINCVPKEDCFLCQRAARKENNLAIISLNTFEMFDVEINRYDSKGNLIEEEAGTLSLRSLQPSEGGFRVSVMEDQDRGYAYLTVTLGSDEKADRKTAAGFLCKDCLEEILPKEGRKKTGLGAIDLATGEIEVFDRPVVGFTLGDFYVHCDWDEKKEETLKLLIFYCPPRY